MQEKFLSNLITGIRALSFNWEAVKCKLGAESNHDSQKMNSAIHNHQICDERDYSRDETPLLKM